MAEFCSAGVTTVESNCGVLSLAELYIPLTRYVLSLFASAFAEASTPCSTGLMLNEKIAPPCIYLGILTVQGHTSTIFAVKFMPSTGNEQIITSAADRQVR